MKTKLLVLAFCLVSLTACHTPIDGPLAPGENYYLGTVSVLYEGEYFNNEDIKVLFSPEGNRASITLHRIRFVPKMPVRIDVTIPDIQLQEGSDGVFTFSCTNVIPLALGGEYPRYTVTDLKGNVSEQHLSFSLNFGDYPTSFTGTLMQ